MTTDLEHIPVLLKETVKILEPKKGKRYIDATLGFAGHSIELIKRGAEVLAIEWDPEVLKKVKERLGKTCPNATWSLVNGNFAEIVKIAQENDFLAVDGILFDLGISRWHYKEAKRGFSFYDENLDMRLNPSLKNRALEIINCYSYEQLKQTFAKIAQEQLAGPIAQALVRTRRIEEIKSAKKLAEIVKDVYQRKRIRTRLEPATKVFLALRTVVNQELENLREGLKGAVEILKSGGKLLVITFNSNEDRIVKEFFKEKKRRGEMKERQLIYPEREEVKANPLSRSAKLRAAIKT